MIATLLLLGCVVVSQQISLRKPLTRTASPRDKDDVWWLETEAENFNTFFRFATKDILQIDAAVSPGKVQQPTAWGRIRFQEIIEFQDENDVAGYQPDSDPLVAQARLVPTDDMRTNHLHDGMRRTDKQLIGVNGTLFKLEAEVGLDFYVNSVWRDASATKVDFAERSKQLAQARACEKLNGGARPLLCGDATSFQDLPPCRPGQFMYDVSSLLDIVTSCCLTCKPMEANRTVMQKLDLPANLATAASVQLNMDCATEAYAPEDQDTTTLDPSTVKWGLNLKNIPRQSDNSSLAVRVAVDSLDIGGDKFVYLGKKTDSQLAAAEVGNLDGDVRFDLGDEEALLLSGSSDKSQVVLTWVTEAEVTGCEGKTDKQTATVTFSQELSSTLSLENSVSEKFQRASAFFDKVGATKAFTTVIYYLSVDLSECRGSPTLVEIDPNISLVFQTEAGDLGDEGEQLGVDVPAVGSSPADTGNGTIIVVIGCVIGVVLIAVVIAALALVLRSRKSSNQLSEGLA